MPTTGPWAPPNPVSPLIFRGNMSYFVWRINSPGTCPIFSASLSRLRVLLDALWTISVQAWKLLTTRNVLAREAGGWKSKMLGPASTEGRLRLSYPSRRAERGCEQEEAKVDDDADIRNSLTWAELPRPNCCLKIRTPYALALQTFITHERTCRARSVVLLEKSRSICLLSGMLR